MKRFDKGYFYYSLVSSLVTAFVILLAFFNVASDDEFGMNLPFMAAVYVIIYIVLVIYAALFVKTSGYELTEAEIRCKRGVLFRKSSVLQYSRVHAVNKKQGLIQRIFGIAVLTVDSGATANSFSAEISIIEKTEIVDRLMLEIKQRQEGKDNVTDEAVKDEQKEAEGRQNLYFFTSRLKLAYSAITVGATLLCLLVLGGAAAVLVSIAAYVLKSSVYLSLGELALSALIITVIVLVLCAVISLIGGIVTSFLGYYDFKVFRNRDDVEVNYGLFVRHTNNFKFGRVKAIRIHQGPIKKLFGFASAGLEVVGYGNGGNDNNNNNSNAAPGVLLPLCKAKDINNVIESIMPDYVPDGIENKSKSYPAFILWSFFGTAVSFAAIFAVMLTVMVMLSAKADIILKTALLVAVALAAVLIAIAVFCIFQYRNAGLTIGKDRLTIQNGIFVKTNTVIRRKDLIAIEKITTPLRKAKGIYSYKIHFFTNALTNTVTVKNLDAGLAAQLENFLKY